MQRKFISKDYSSSPTIATKNLLFSCIIYAEDKRDIYVIDNHNAFIQTRVENENKMAVMKIRGFLLELLLKIDPGFYGPFVTTAKRGKDAIIVQCMNAIYGTMVASLLY